jgi:peptide-methionine (S)-S-oxide reductase
VRTRVGYAGGTHPDPTYHDLGDHTEAFQLDFDPAVITYDELLAMFWASHKPDRASYSRQYMAAVFAAPDQEAAALASRPAGARTPVIAGTSFTLAEDYHQKYYLRHTPDLWREVAELTAQELVDSPRAAKLNGQAWSRRMSGVRGKLA